MISGTEILPTCPGPRSCASGPRSSSVGSVESARGFSPVVQRPRASLQATGRLVVAVMASIQLIRVCVGRSVTSVED